MSIEGQQPTADDEVSTGGDELLSQLKLIEHQPLEARADAFTQIHDRLRSQLEGGDAPQRHA